MNRGPDNLGGTWKDTGRGRMVSGSTNAVVFALAEKGADLVRADANHA